MRVVIDEDRCVVCGECVVVCPVDVFEKEEDRVVVKRPENCFGCLSCSYICRSDAITHEGIYIERKLVYDVKILNKLNKII